MALKMNIARFSTILRTIFNRDSKKLLGRWEITYCEKKLKNTVDLANEDHCGPCGTSRPSDTLNESKVNVVTVEKEIAGPVIRDMK